VDAAEVRRPRPDVPLGIINDSGEFFRSGSSGQLRQWLTDEDVTRYKERIAALALADFVHWLHYGGHS
jgi:hypothetical protein